MKSLLKINPVFALFACAVSFLSFSAMEEAQTKVTPNEKAIEEVKQGKRKVAYASWWGFDPEDSAEALQAAIDSGAPRVIVNNMGKPWVISRTINLRSDQEVVFERGVIVEAEQGAFRGKGDCLFLASLQKNLTLIGYGAVLRMRKLDYTKPPYEKAEWRHALSIRSCDNVRVYGLTLASSGGDGIYLGVAKRGVPNTNVHIKDVVCVDNYRQGISVISAENLLMENIVMKDTGGTPPMAGIDFEPNEPTERLVNIVMRNCVSQNNSGDGFVFALNNLKSSSHPISIRLEGCRSVGNRRGVSINAGNRKEDVVGGIVEFVDCEFEGSEGAGIFIGQKSASGFKVRFVRCKVTNAAVKLPEQSPVVFASVPGNFEPIGGVEFADCVVKDEIDRMPMAYLDFVGGLELTDIVGKFALIRGSQKKVYELNRDLLNKWFPKQAFKVFPKFEVESVKFEPLSPEMKLKWVISSNAKLRGRAEFLVWAESGSKVSFTLSVEPVGKVDALPAKVKLLTPSGRTVELKDAVSKRDNEYNFVADETGAYIIVSEAGRATTTMKSCSHRFCLFAADGVFHFLGTVGEFFFFVPAKIGEFGVKVIGDVSELVKVVISDEEGRIIAERDNIKCEQFVVKRENVERGEIFIIRFERPSTGVLEDFHVQLQGIPPSLAPAKEALLKPSGK